MSCRREKGGGCGGLSWLVWVREKKKVREESFVQSCGFLVGWSDGAGGRLARWLGRYYCRYGLVWLALDHFWIMW